MSIVTTKSFIKFLTNKNERLLTALILVL